MTEEVQLPTRVFISYSWDSKAHGERVLALANTLRNSWGIEADIDQYVRAKPPFTPLQGWDRWMERKIEWAEFVLLICTEVYKRRFRGEEEPGVGRGVTWEGTIIRQCLYNSHLRNVKFIPVVFSSEDLVHIPIILNGNDNYVLEDEKSFGELRCRLNKNPTVVVPDVVPAKLHKPPKPKFFSPSNIVAESILAYPNDHKLEDSNLDLEEQEETKTSPGSSGESFASSESILEERLAAPLQTPYSFTPTFLKVDSDTLRQNLVNLEKQGTVEECEKVIAQTCQWLLQHPSESYVRTQLLKIAQSKAAVAQQRLVAEQTSRWLSAYLKDADSYVLTEYLKLVTSEGTTEQVKNAILIALSWLDKNQKNDAYVRRNCLVLARDKATFDTAQELIDRTYFWLIENLEECDSYIMMEYLRLLIEKGTGEQRQRAKSQAESWLERSDNSYVRNQYLKLLRIIE